MKRAVMLLGVAVAIVALPLFYVASGHRTFPFAGDLVREQAQFAGQEVVLPMVGVLETEPGWALLGDVAGNLRVRADGRFGLRAGESLNVRLTLRDGAFEVIGVGRHETRGIKYLISTPVLLGVILYTASRLRWSRTGRGVEMLAGRQGAEVRCPIS